MEKQTKISRPIKLGIIGAGFMGQMAHLENCLSVKECEVVALAELRPRLRKLVCEKYGIKESYETHLEMLKHSDIDAVVIVTKRPMLGPVALDCLEAGKHVLMEKPVGATVEQIQRLAHAAEKKNLTCSAGYMRRHDTGVSQAKNILDNLIKTQELGSIVFIRSYCFQGDCGCDFTQHVQTDENRPEGMDGMEGWTSAPDWIPEARKNDYAVFNNVFCHDINLLRYLLGGDFQVKFSQLSRSSGMVTVFGCGNFLTVLEIGTGDIPSRLWNEGVEIYLEKGLLDIKLSPNFFKEMSADVTLLRKGKAPEVFSFRDKDNWAFRNQIKAFLKDIQLPEESKVAVSDAVKDVEIIENIWRKELKLNK